MANDCVSASGARKSVVFAVGLSANTSPAKILHSSTQTRIARIPESMNSIGSVRIQSYIFFFNRVNGVENLTGNSPLVGLPDRISNGRFLERDFRESDIYSNLDTSRQNFEILSADKISNGHFLEKFCAIEVLSFVSRFCRDSVEILLRL